MATLLMVDEGMITDVGGTLTAVESDRSSEFDTVMQLRLKHQCEGTGTTLQSFASMSNVEAMLVHRMAKSGVRVYVGDAAPLGD